MHHQRHQTLSRISDLVSMIYRTGARFGEVQLSRSAQARMGQSSGSRGPMRASRLQRRQLAALGQDSSHVLAHIVKGHFWCQERHLRCEGFQQAGHPATENGTHQHVRVQDDGSRMHLLRRASVCSGAFAQCIEVPDGGLDLVLC